MDVLTSAQMVQLWEKGRTRPDHERAIDIMQLALPDLTREALFALPVGERNRTLFTLRKAASGESLRAFVQCPNCSEPLEFEQSISELMEEGRQGESTAQIEAQGEAQAEAQVEARNHRFAKDGYTVQFRLPNSADQAAGADLFFEEEVADHILDATILGVEHKGENLPASGLPEELREDIRAQQARLDPLANPTVCLGCAACKHVWHAPIDIAAFFWVEIERQARAVIDDVVMLARGYGWREEDILAMGASRRELYLDALETA